VSGKGVDESWWFVGYLTTVYEHHKLFIAKLDQKAGSAA
jgi:hypothetical protein